MWDILWRKIQATGTHLGHSPLSCFAFLSYRFSLQTADLANANASEDDKMKAMMAQATKDYDSSKCVLIFTVN